MAYQKFIYMLIHVCTTYQAISQSANGVCDKSRCEGPLAYYKALGCTPIYGEDTCCPVRYNCDYLNERSVDKCYVNGHVYELGASLRDEDAGPCDVRCKCVSGLDGIAGFSCAVVNCSTKPPKPGCYFERSPTQCCSGPEVCPKTPDDRAKCEVDGKTYLDGEDFVPESNSSLSCICQPGFQGMLVEPFCIPTPSCRIELLRAVDIYQNCAPVYNSTQNPATDCSFSSRCQNRDDAVLPAANPGPSNPAYLCHFGNLTMKIGEELNQVTDCVRCVCEVPPISTCQQSRNGQCNITGGGLPVSLTVSLHC